MCSKPSGKCPFPHVNKEKEKKVAPAKPKRKSLGHTPADQKRSRVAAARYFDRDVKTDDKEDLVNTPGSTSSTFMTSETSSEMEARRKRLLRKIELAKQGWTGISVSVVDEDEDLEEDTVIHHDKLDDSGPYEKITDENDDLEESASSRPPIGQLGDFISLAGYSSEDEELHSDHRLI